MSLADMNCAWVENRVPRTCMEDLKRRCRLTREELDEEENAKTKSMFRLVSPPSCHTGCPFLNVCARYPRNLRGIGEVWKTIASELPAQWFHLGNPVIGIDPRNREVGMFSSTNIFL